MEEVACGYGRGPVAAIRPEDCTTWNACLTEVLESECKCCYYTSHKMIPSLNIFIFYLNVASNVIAVV